jgi:hypothetical protein
MIKVGEKKDLGVCPDCGDKLVGIYGITRCSGCDYTEHDVVRVAEERIVQGERGRLFDKLPKLTIPYRRKSDEPEYIDDAVHGG